MPFIGFGTRPGSLQFATGMAVGGIFTPDPYTTMLLSMTGSHGSSDFPDTALGGVGNPHTFTPVGANIITSQNDPFGNNVGVGDFTRSLSEYLSTPLNADDNLTDVFCVEAWVKASSPQSSPNDFYICGCRGGSPDGWRFGVQTFSPFPRLYFEFPGQGLTSATEFPENVWVHCAAVRDSGGLLSLYENGVRVDSATNAATIPTGSTFYVGKWSSGGDFWDGQISNFRISQGTDRGYAGATITLPTAPFSP